jgi:hypothetical protein
MVRDLFMRFNDIDDVLLCTDMSRGELDRLCHKAWGKTAEQARDKFAAQGRAHLKEAQFSAAMDGDRSMLIALGRQYLGQTEDGKPAKQEEKKEATVLDFVRGNYADAKDRKSKAAH